MIKKKLCKKIQNFKQVINFIDFIRENIKHCAVMGEKLIKKYITHLLF